MVEPKYTLVYPFNEGMAAVSSQQKVGFINSKGIEVVKPQYDWTDRPHGFSEGLAYVIKDGKKGFVNKSGKLVIQPLYDIKRTANYALGFKEGRTLVSRDGEWGFIDKSGQVIASTKYNKMYDVSNFSEGLAAVKVGKRWGYIRPVRKYYSARSGSYAY